MDTWLLLLYGLEISHSKRFLRLHMVRKLKHIFISQNKCIDSFSIPYVMFM